jgi:hypothetical protein
LEEFVTVNTDGMMMVPQNVKYVTSNVVIAQELPIIVTLVLETEKEHQIVQLVQMEPMTIPSMLIVNNVQIDTVFIVYHVILMNVQNVMTLIETYQTVNVPTDMLT